MQTDELVNQKLISSIGEQFSLRNLTLSTAESCTGGLLGGVLTSKPGASEWYRGGVITYSNEAKINVLSVPPEILEAHGAVSRETALAMVIGVRSLFESDISFSVTGIAGPGGGTPDKPIGTVWMALAGKTIRIEKQVFAGSRKEIRMAAVNHILKMLAECAGESPK